MNVLDRIHRLPLVWRTLAAAVGLGATASAATTWVPLVANSPPGTPAQIVLDPAASNATDTYFDVFVKGYWSTPVNGPDGTPYVRIEVPGLGHFGQVGAPDLPAARVRIACATGASQLHLLSAVPVASTSLTGIRVLPLPVEETDDPPESTGDPGPGDPDGTPETFALDPAIYGANASWPPTFGLDPVPVERWFGKIPSGDVAVYPIHFNPATLVVQIATQLRCRYQHPGTPAVQPMITKDLAKVATAGCINWPELAPWITADTTHYAGRYLFLAPSSLMPTLQPLIEHRKACGFATTQISLVGNFSSAALRTIIDGWYQLGAPGYDHYCLLVGDTDQIPLCASPTTDVKYSDDGYGSPAGIADLNEEVFVGRLSVDNAVDLGIQIGKILDYELHPKIGGAYDKALLVAHKQDAPLKYQGNCEEVASKVYAVPPAFVKRYGATPGIDNGDVIDVLNDGVGIVSYRGHGSTNTWYDWNLFGQDFHKNDVVGLTLQPFEPVVWSFSCTNQNVDYSGGTVDCIGENWMEHALGGGVAHYGSTTVSGTHQNHALHRAMFRAVFDCGLTVHSQAIAFAEHQMACEEPGLNSWCYMLLGDPAMKIRRFKPKKPAITGPDEITAKPVGQTATFQVKDAAGNPLPNVLVSLHKEAFPPGAQPEILANAYSGTSGIVQIPLGPTSFGTIDWTGRDDDGNIANGKIPVVTGPWKDLGGGKFGGNGMPVLGGLGTLKPNSANSIELHHAPAGRAAILFVGLADSPTPFVGGVLHPVPFALSLNFVTDAAGSVPFVIGSWPAEIPSDTTLVFQYAIDDPAATSGIGLSNGLLAVTP